MSLRTVWICLPLFLALGAAPALRAAPPGPLPCAAEAQAAIADTRTGLTVLSPPPNAINGLTAKLDAAEQSVDKGNANAARGQLGALINQIEALAANGSIAAGDAEALLAALRAAVAVVTTCSGMPRVSFFNVRSGDAMNDLFWVNPASPTFAATRILFRTDTYPTGPTDPSATQLGVFAGAAAARSGATHAGLSNGTSYYYAAFAVDGAGSPSAAKVSRGRPDSTTKNFRWAYTIDSPRAAVSLTFSHLPAVSSDALHAMAAGANGGGWPGGWSPVKIPAPAMARPTAIPGGSSPAIGHVSLVGSRTGRVHAVNLDSATVHWTSPDLGGAVQSGISGDLFGAPPHLLFVGVQRPDGTGALYALQPSDGTVAWLFDNAGNMGPVTTAPAVDLANDRVYFTSRARAGASTVWCLDYAATSASLRWSVNAGDVHTSPTRRTATRSAIYVGNTAGEIHALDPLTGGSHWSAPYNTTDGPIHDFVFPATATNRIFYSTANHVHALDDVGSAPQPFWPAPVPVPASAVPLRFGDRVYVATRAGRIVQIDEASGIVQQIVSVGDPARPSGLGAPGIFAPGPLISVGSQDGFVYTLRIPFQ